MKKQELIDYVEAIAEPLAASMSYEVYDIDYEKEGPNWYLRVFMDKEGGFSINDCVDFSHALEEKLDDDRIENAYILEVSSPGLDRVLKKDKDFQKNLGKIADVKLYQPLNASIGRSFQAELTAYDAESQTVTLTLEDGQALSLNRKDISGIRLAVIF